MRGGLDRSSHGLGAGAMPGNSRLVPACGPPAIAVHNDRNVWRKSLGIYLSEQELVNRTGLDVVLKFS